MDFTPDVEQTSIDEGYSDLSEGQEDSSRDAMTLRQIIGQSLKISVSEGIGPNKVRQPDCLKKL